LQLVIFLKRRQLYSITETGNGSGSFLGSIKISINDTEKNKNIMANVGDMVIASFEDYPDGDGESTRYEIALEIPKQEQSRDMFLMRIHGNQ